MIFRSRSICPVSLFLVGATLSFGGCALHPKPRYVHRQMARPAPHPRQPPEEGGLDADRQEENLPGGVDDHPVEAGGATRPRQADVVRALPDVPHRKKLAASIRAFLNARYKLGGQDANAVDCSGFVKAVYQEVYGRQLPRKAGEMYRLGTPIAQPSLRPGDLVFFSHPESDTVNHVGIYLSGKKFVHSSVSQGVTISNLADAYWQERFAGGRRL